MLLNTCMGTGTTGKASMIDPHHRRFTDCENDDASVEKLMPSLPATFVRQILNEKSDIVEIADAKKAAALALQRYTSAPSGLTKMT